MDGEPKGGDPSTLIASDLSSDGPRASIATMGQVYARVAQLLGLGAAHASGPGYRIFWSDGGDLAFKDVPALDGSFAIVGRHTKCDARLESDEAISLRHLLLRPMMVDGVVALRVLDLRGGLAFFLDDDTPHRSIMASGPVALRLGRYILCAVPLGAGPADLAPNRRVDASAERASIMPLPSYRVGTEDQLSLPPPADEDAAAPSTRITLRRGVTSVEELEPPDAPGSARLVVAGSRGTASVDVSAEDLADGVLVGRSDRCLDGGIASVLSNQISRAHVLILESGGVVEAFDLCSTNGTWRNGRRTRYAKLPDQGMSLKLGTRITLSYQRRST